MEHAFEWGKLLKCHLKGIICRKWANGLKICDSEKNLDPKGWSGHMTKMAAMPIYGKTLQNSSPEPLDRFQRNLA